MIERCLQNDKTLPIFVEGAIVELQRSVARYVGLKLRTVPSWIPPRRPHDTAEPWNLVAVNDAQNERFHDLLRRYAPLFPQRSDRTPHEVAAPVWSGGRCKRPAILCAPLLESDFNQFMCIDRTNTDENMDAWKWLAPPQVDNNEHSQDDLDENGELTYPELAVNH